MFFKKKAINKMWDERFLEDIDEAGGEKNYERRIRNSPIQQDYLEFKKRKRR